MFFNCARVPHEKIRLGKVDFANFLLRIYDKFVIYWGKNV